MADDYTNVVAGVKADLVARGVSLSGPCGAFQITGRVAWLLRAAGYGLVAKNDGQNGCTMNGERYAVDAVMLRDGQTFDLLVNSETENRPAWQHANPAPATSWRQSFDMDPAETRPAPPVVVAVPPVPPATPQAPPDGRLDAIVAALGDLARAVARVEATQAAGLGGAVLGYKVRLKP